MSMWCDVLDDDIRGKPRQMAPSLVAREQFLKNKAEMLVKPGFYLREQTNVTRTRTWSTWCAMRLDMFEQMDREAGELGTMKIEEAHTFGDKGFNQRLTEFIQTLAAYLGIETILGLLMILAGTGFEIHKSISQNKSRKNSVRSGRLSREQRLQ
ncbi:hypothetical protein DOTSEDRAFT_175727 [Dothistroma septosporum NZE10]|uniref:Uncharacterized protein n=1 Tax=Dothistroma septosporum (strain NZE10 / CBS 128990) TaxID=675120 RepID=N1PJG8_DOTSN|nr:hypothetical protein DOTSEDRAFT_175727 [Dothistroma septosporum NZE10]